jgi:hypothetical protein
MFFVNYLTKVHFFLKKYFLFLALLNKILFIVVRYPFCTDFLALGGGWVKPKNGEAHFWARVGDAV